MAKALFLGLPLHGHTNPSLPVVRELVQRGDEVVYYSADAFAAKIEHTGARYRPYRYAFLANITQLPERTEQLAWLLARTTAEVLEGELAAFRAERPDYLITDSVAPWGQWVGALLKVPVVTSVSTFAVNRHVLAFAATHGVRPKSARLVLSKMKHVAKALLLARRLTRQYGVKHQSILGLVFGHSDLNIVYTSRAFQPCGDTFDDRYQFVGPSLSQPIVTVPGVPGVAAPPVLLLVSLGTVFNTDEAFYRNCFEAFKGEDLRVIMSIGTSISEVSLGPPPPNFVLQAHVPQLDVLGRASAFVTHGGMNSVGESLSNGVPIVVVPQMGEQEIVGRRVEELGAGLYVAKTEATPERLRASVRRLLTDDRFRQQAAVVRQSFQTAGGVARAAGAIQAFTR